MKGLAAVRFSLVAAFLVLSAAGVRADNWPQWRGANGDGICTEKNVPTEWSESKNVLWKLPMPGMGSSTPAVWGDRMFLTSEAGDDLLVLCVSTQGKELWRKTVSSGKQRFMRGEGNNSSPSCSTDGKLVFSFFGTGELACFDLDGKEVWKFNVQERYGKIKIQHGMHVTPLLLGDRLYHALLHEGGMWVVALDKATGKEIWKFERKTDGIGEGRHSYASPVLWRKGKDEYLIVHGCDYTTAHSLEDGHEIWRLGELNPQGQGYRRDLRFVATPAATPDLIVVPTAKEYPILGINPAAKGFIGKGSEAELWRFAKTPDVPTPLVHEGLVYLSMARDGVLHCLDAKTGKPVYQDQRTHNALHRASPVYADGKIYVTARDGYFTVIKAGPKFEIVASNKLPDTFTASPAISNGKIYLRGWETLYCIGEAK